MQVTRRNFLKLVATATGLVAASGLALFKHIRSIPDHRKKSVVSRSFCPFCSLHCEVDLFVRKNRIVGVEAVANSFASNGKVCPKAHLLHEKYSTTQFRTSYSQRLANSSRFTQLNEKSAVETVASLIKESRDNSFVVTDNTGLQINACDSVAVLAGDYLGNENSYLINKFSRICGFTKVGTASLVKEEGAKKAFQSTLGISALPNPYYDIENSNVVLIVGANPVVKNPVTTQYICGAKERGATVIVVDSAQSETSRIADLYVPCKPGTDLLLVSGVINYLLRNRHVDFDYLRNNSDAPFLINEEFSVDNNGIFSGYDALTQEYDSLTWSYAIDERGNPKTDFNLKKDNTVFQTLLRFYSRYSSSKTVEGCEIRSDLFLKLAEIIGFTSRENRSCSVIYGGGFSGTAGEQGVRALLILQTLCGNIGVAGGGIYGLHDSDNAQGVADQIGGWNLLPGYLPLPDSEKMESNYNEYIKSNSQKSNDQTVSNLWKNFKIHFEAQMSLWFPGVTGEKAFSLLPKASSQYTTQKFFNDLDAGIIKGVILFDYDLYNSGISKKEINRLFSKLQWVVVFESEKGKFSDYIGSLSFSPKTTVVFLPMNSVLFDELSYTSSDRHLSVKESVTEKGDQFPTLGFMLGKVLKNLQGKVRNESTGSNESLMGYGWNCETVAAVRAEMEGGISQFGQEVHGYGNWLYNGLFADYQKAQEYRSESVGYMRTGGALWPQMSQVLFNKSGLNFSSGLSRTEKSVIPGDRLIGGKELRKHRPSYFNRDGVAYLFSRKTVSGPLPTVQKNVMSANILEDTVLSPKYLLFSGKSTESRYPQNYPVYREMFGRDALYMHVKEAKRRGLVTGDSVTVVAGNNMVTTVVIATSRVLNSKSVLFSGAAVSELLTAKELFPIEVTVVKGEV